MRDDLKMSIQVGTVVQANQHAPGDGCYTGCFMVVTEPKAWGAEGYVQIPTAKGQLPSRVPLRLQWKEMEFVGQAHYVSRPKM